MATRKDWAASYARQASADFEAFSDASLRSDILRHACHRLQFLQMASEKLCKAHALLSEENTLESVTSQHNYIKKFLATILAQELFELLPGKKDQIKQLKTRFKQIGVEIEALCPAINRTQRPDNCEYPWLAGTNVESPLDWKFESLQFLNQAGGRTFLKCMKTAVDRLVTMTT